MEEKGYTQVTAWVHNQQAADVQTALRDNADLSIGPLRNTATGKLTRAR